MQFGQCNRALPSKDLQEGPIDLSARHSVPDREADDLGWTVEIAEGISHPTKLRTAHPRLKPICSDKACVMVKAYYGAIEKDTWRVPPGSGETIRSMAHSI